VRMACAYAAGWSASPELVAPLARLLSDSQLDVQHNAALALGRIGTPAAAKALRKAVSDRADELRLPLVWPEGWPTSGQGAMRVAAMAAERGLAPPFVLAAGRLAFCGGYDLDDPEVIAEAAAAAGLALDDAFAAAGQMRRDGGMERDAMRLLRRGADELPAAVVGRHLFAGEGRLAEAAAAAAAAPGIARRRTAGPG